MLEEGPEADDQSFSRRQISFRPHPRAWPVRQIGVVSGEIGWWCGGGAVYGGSLGRFRLLRHGADHDFKPLPPFSGFCLRARLL